MGGRRADVSRSCPRISWHPSTIRRSAGSGATVARRGGRVHTCRMPSPGERPTATSLIRLIPAQRSAARPTALVRSIAPSPSRRGRDPATTASRAAVGQISNRSRWPQRGQVGPRSPSPGRSTRVPRSSRSSGRNLPRASSSPCTWQVQLIARCIPIAAAIRSAPSWTLLDRAAHAIAVRRSPGQGQDHDGPSRREQVGRGQHQQGEQPVPRHAVPPSVWGAPRFDRMRLARDVAAVRRPRSFRQEGGVRRLRGQGNGRPRQRGASGAQALPAMATAGQSHARAAQQVIGAPDIGRCRCRRKKEGGGGGAEDRARERLLRRDEEP